MDRDEILSRSRKDFRGADEVMLDTLKQAGKVSSEVGLAITAIIFAVEAFFFNSFNFAIVGVYLSIEASKELVKYSKLKDKKYLLYGILTAIIAVMIVLAHFTRMNG